MILLVVKKRQASLTIKMAVFHSRDMEAVLQSVRGLKGMRQVLSALDYTLPAPKVSTSDTAQYINRNKE
jgi:hypothetical protein